MQEPGEWVTYRPRGRARQALASPLHEGEFIVGATLFVVLGAIGGAIGAGGRGALIGVGGVAALALLLAIGAMLVELISASSVREPLSFANVGYRVAGSFRHFRELWLRPHAPATETGTRHRFAVRTRRHGAELREYRINDGALQIRVLEVAPRSEAGALQELAEQRERRGRSPEKDRQRAKR